jgi:hypothetical protein
VNGSAFPCFLIEVQLLAIKKKPQAMVPAAFADQFLFSANPRHAPRIIKIIVKKGTSGPLEKHVYESPFIN